MKNSLIIALFLAGSQAHRLHHKNHSGVRFATGMNGDEDLGQDITMKGEKFHYQQTDNAMVQLKGDGEGAAEEAKEAPTGLPLCDGGNGTVGVDCLYSGNYPRKLKGSPYGPTGHYYPTKKSNAATHAAADVGTQGEYGVVEPNYTYGMPQYFYLQTEESNMKLLPLCNGGDGTLGVDCVSPAGYPKKLAGTPYAPTGWYYPTKKSNAATHTAADVGTQGEYNFVEPNYQYGMPQYFYLQTAEENTKLLPLCNGGDGTLGVDCVSPAGYPKKLAGTPYAPTGWYYPTKKSNAATHTAADVGTQAEYGVVEPNYRYGMPQYFYAQLEPIELDQEDNLLYIQLIEQHRAHKAHLKAQKKKQDAGEEVVEQDTSGEAEEEEIVPLPACVEGDGLKKGIECKEPEKLPKCENNEHTPALKEGETATCRILPLCKDVTGDAECFKTPAPEPEVVPEVIVPEVVVTPAFAQLPTCDQWITTNCQPVCNRDLTVGCTEERTPEPPRRDRFEGKWTWKPGQTTIQPRILPRDGN